MWVGKLAYLAADPMTIQEGRRAIAQAITNCWVKVRGPGCPCVNPLAQQPFRFDSLRGSPMKDASRDGGLIINPHHISPQEAENAIDIGETKGLRHLGSPHLPQIMGSRVTGVYYQWLPRYHLGLTGQMDPWHPRQGRWHWEDGAHMKINLPVFKDEDAKDAVTYQSCRWDLMVYWHVQGAGITPSYPMQLDLCKVILVS